jgi:hypothetical protein
MARGGHHHHVDVGGRLDALEAVAVTAGEVQHLPAADVLLHVPFVHLLLDFVRQAHQHQVGPGRCPGDGEDRKPVPLGFLIVGIPAVAHDHFQPAVPQVAGLGASLVAVPDHTDDTIFQGGQINIFIEVDLAHGDVSLESRPLAGLSSRAG